MNEEKLEVEYQKIKSKSQQDYKDLFGAEALSLKRLKMTYKVNKFKKQLKNFLYTVIATIAALYVYYLISGEVICFKHR
jgi:hypothetical protein